MMRSFRDPFLWGSLFFVAIFPAGDFYILERNYYDSGSYFPFGILMLGLQGLWFIWLLICVFVTIHRLRKWRWSHAGCLAAAILVFPLNIFLGSNALWQHHNFYRFHEARLDYARRGDGNWGECRSGVGNAGDLPGPYLSLEGTQPETYGTSSGPYVFYRTFTGIPYGFWGFLYAPSLEDPVSRLPHANLKFAQLWDRDACVFLVGR